jgi:ATP synthase protein I
MAVLLQVGSVTILALGAALVVDWSSALFVALGGTAAIVPNGLFAMRLAFHRGRSPESYPVVFFLGQFAKIGLTVGLLGAISKWAGPVQWLPLLLGLIVALKAPLFALLYVPSEPARGDRRWQSNKGGMQTRPDGRREAFAQVAGAGREAPVQVVSGERGEAPVQVAGARREAPVQPAGERQDAPARVAEVQSSRQQR